MAFLCRHIADGISLAVKVMPKSRQPGLLGLAPDRGGERLRVGVTAAPEGGRVTGDPCALMARAILISTTATDLPT